jgi:YfiH family protein
MSLISEILREPGIAHGFTTRDEAQPEALTLARQVHGARVHVVEAPGETPDEGCDALLAQQTGLRVGVVTADCVPLLLADIEARVVAAVHSGWRGTVKRISVATVDAMIGQGADLTRLRAAIGPAIGPCCYEVSSDVADQVVAASTQEARVEKTPRPYVDLGLAVQRQLEGCGLGAGQIERIPGCTQCDPQRFHSYRRDGDGAGRQWSWIAVTEEGA